MEVILCLWLAKEVDLFGYVIIKNNLKVTKKDLLGKWIFSFILLTTFVCPDNLRIFTRKYQEFKKAFMPFQIPFYYKDGMIFLKTFLK